ncbi:MAG: helix-turn-helix domain-containing protein [Acidobacteria bacterium]|nr:helix-turn-helix domain-containing protein [Acidobacteriota bacterium]
MADQIARLLSPQAAAEYLGLSVATLATWRCVGRYPLRFKRIGRSIRYSLADLEDFVQRRTVGGDPEAHAE